MRESEYQQYHELTERDGNPCTLSYTVLKANPHLVLKGSPCISFIAITFQLVDSKLVPLSLKPEHQGSCMKVLNNDTIAQESVPGR